MKLASGGAAGVAGPAGRARGRTAARAGRAVGGPKPDPLTAIAEVGEVLEQVELREDARGLLAPDGDERRRPA